MTVTAKLEDGPTVDMEYGQHPSKGEPKVWLWSGAWIIPPVYPAGVLKYLLNVPDSAGKE